ncbi:MAG: putative sugar kinase [Acidimicrobiales bacterium]|nr:putative sugar kinase [Acidimicrobiales bacterium]
MSTVALFLHGGRPDALTLGTALCAWLQARGHLVVAPADEVALVTCDGSHPAVDQRDLPVDLVVSVGGDGTMLRATSRAVEADAHVMGINLGQLGYLAEVEPGSWEEALEAYFAGRHSMAERLMVAARLVPPDGHPADTTWSALPPALNEVVIEKQAMGRTVRLGVSIDGEFFTSYVADGVIIATPTGSTAYSLSARGPIVAPTHRALLLTAVSPHSLFDRSLVLEPSSTVAVEVLGDRSAAVAVDGEHLRVLPPGASVVVTADDRPARFVTFGERDFHRILKAKFGLNDR